MLGNTAKRCLGWQEGQDRLENIGLGSGLVECISVRLLYWMDTSQLEHIERGPW